MKKLNYLFFILIAFSCTSTKKYNQIIAQKHQVIHLHQDIDVTHKILKENHPGLYWYISKKDLDFKFDSLKKEIKEPLTSKEFFIKIAPVIAAIKCGHTTIRNAWPILNKKEAKAEKEKKKPIHLFTYHINKENKLFTTKNKSDNVIIKDGTEFLEIDGIAVNHIVNELKDIIASDGLNTTFKRFVLEKTFADRYDLYYGLKDSILIKFKTLNDSIGQTWVKLKEKKKIDTNIKKPIKVAKEKKEKFPSYLGALSEGKPQLSFKFLDAKKDFAYLQIKSFSVPLANYDKFYKKSFDSIQLAGTNNLIIDLRYNGGGSLAASRNLFSYLTDQKFVYLDQPVANGNFDARKYGNNFQKVKYFLFGHNENNDLLVDKEGNYYTHFKGYKPLNPHKNNFKGKIYVLINGFSFSASSLLSANLKGINRATFIGEETGGGFNQCVAGILPEIQLKNTKLTLRFGLYKIAPNAKQEMYGRGIFPDVEILPSITDKINNVDKELEWILNTSKK